MRILITGGSGLLGQYLNSELNKQNTILTLYHNNRGNTALFPNRQLDLTDIKALTSLFKEFKPQIVIHLACYSNPQICRITDKKLVLENNVGVSEHIAKLCSDSNSKLIFTSTDLVYKDSPELKNEESLTEPLSLYAETKLMAEEKIRANCKDHIILRTSLLYGIALNHTSNHFTEMISALKENNVVNLFSDQFRTPLSLKNAAGMINEIVHSDINGEILNFGGNEKLSRYELGLKTAEVLEKNSNLVRGVRFKDVSNDTEAPLDVGMDIGKLCGFGIVPKRVDETLSEMLN
ncbi:SDR family oxidoreductase [soil metagenome]